MADTPKGASSGHADGVVATGGRFRSDPPPDDLFRERDLFIQQFFRRGAQLSEELLGDLERLRVQVQGLEQENARLRAQLASDTAIRELLTTVERLEAEKHRLLLESAGAPTGPDPEFVARLSALEEELGHLGAVHVASEQLHSSTSARRALRSLRELLAQFLGAAQYVLFWRAEEAGALVPISFEGLTAREARDVPWEDGPVARAFQTGEPYTAGDADTSQGSPERPAAVVPLRVGRELVGAIAIVRTLPQKTAFVRGDRELFELLGSQAGAAIVHAHHFAQSGKQIPTALAFMDLED